MKKLVLALIAMGVAVTVASPAFAEIKLNGYYRMQMTAESFSPVQDTKSFVDNRLRLMMTNTLNDNISVVYYGEIDTPWGQAGKAAYYDKAGTPAISGGGTVGADGVNFETKNAYVHFKLPDTSFSVRTGILGWGTGDQFEDLIISNDMAGLNVVGDLGPVKTNFIYSKHDEGDTNLWDDTDFYAVKLGMKAGADANLTALAGYLDANAAASTSMFAGLNGSMKIADIGLEAFVLYRSFAADDTTGAADEEGSAYAFDLKGKMKMPFGGMKAHFAYFSADDDAQDDNSFTPDSGGWAYHSDNMSIFLTDVYYNNGSQGLMALKDAAYTGYGLMFLTVSGDIKMDNAMYAKYGVGYFTAVDDTINGAAVASKAGTDLGFEVDAMIGKKFAEKYDVSLRGAYAMTGDFYKTAAGDDADDIFKIVAMVNVGF